MVAFEPSVPGVSSGLGTNAITVTPLRKTRQGSQAFREARRQRFARRSVSSRWLTAATIAEHGADDFVKMMPRPGSCGWAAGEAVGVHKAEDGPARFSGVQSCSSVWSCACCGALIRGRRSEEVQDAAAWWEKSQGGSFLFLTLTVRHYAADTLGRTMDALTGAFTAMINGAPWKRFSRTHGIRHFIKSQEVTLGWDNGWHAHLHVLLFVDLPGAAADLATDAAAAWDAVAENPNRNGSPNRARVGKAQRLDVAAAEAQRIAGQGISVERERELHAWLYERWAGMVVEHGGRRPSKRRGVDIRTVRHGHVVALYVAKLQEGDRARKPWQIGHEMSRQDMKKGRVDSLVPLELLDVDGLSPEEAERNRDWWIEYVTTTHGRRAMTWSRGLKEAAGIDDLDDEDIVAAEDAETAEDDRVIVIRAVAWRGIKHDADVLARILELVESDRLEEIARLVPWEYPPPDTGHRSVPLNRADKLRGRYGRTSSATSTPTRF